MPSRTLPPALRPAPGPRLITVPDVDPPYDCDPHGAACPERRTGPGAEPYGGEQTATADPPGSGSPGSGSAALGPAFSGWSASSASAGASAWPRQFAQVLVEILAGARSPRQIVPCTTDRVRANIDILTLQVTAGARPRIQRIVMSHPTTHAVEMTVIVSFGSRARALALRCEHLPPRPAAPGRPGRPARWLCTELEAG
jgi:hypothetical protein